jgi:F-type H+-transporting ATPase subunit epsilon
MSANTFNVEIVTPDSGVVISRQVKHLRLPGIEGYFGILAGHADLMAALGTGIVELETDSGENLQLALSGGFAQISGGNSRILAESAELPGSVDQERAEKARKRALARINQAEGKVDVDRAQLSLARALNRLRLSR